MQRRILVALALIGLLSVVLVSRAGAAPTISRVSTSPVTSAAGAVGTSTLVRSDRGIAVSLQTTRLPSGHAVTVWWMVVNPGAAAPSVLYAAGHVVDDSGTAGFGGALQEGDTDGVVELPGLSLAACWMRAVPRWCWWCATTAPPGLTSSSSRSTPSTSATPTCTDLQLSIHAPAG